MPDGQDYDCDGEVDAPAFEIHNFANKIKDQSIVIMKARLLEAGVEEDDILSYEECLGKIRQSAKKEQISLNSAFESYVATEKTQYQNVLRITATFVSLFYENSFDAWVRGFVVDSAEAYDNEPGQPESSSARASCPKGFWERTISCLNRLDHGQLNQNDPQLIKLLGGQEEALMLKNKLENFVIPSFIIAELNKANFNKNCSMDSLKQKTKEILRSQFTADEEFAKAMEKVEENAVHGFWETVFEDFTGHEQSEEKESS